MSSFQEIITQLNSEGYPIRDFIPDGKVHRFEIEKGDRQAGYYVGFQNNVISTGELFYVVQYGSWRTGELKTYSTLKGPMTARDKDNQRDQMAKAQKLQEAVKREGQEIAAKECEEKWAILSDYGNSEYLDKKKVSGCPKLGIKFDNFTGDIYVPVRDENGKLWSLQSISRSGDKHFHSGARIKDCFHFVGGGERSESVYIAEGLATSASIALATGARVACAFSASGLRSIAVMLRRILPDATKIVVAGDDDTKAENLRDGGNRGRETAESAAKAISSSFVLPSFRGGKGGDWNDLHCTEGIEVVSAQLCEKNIEAPKMAVFALGMKEKEYFFTSTQNRQIVPIRSGDEKDFINLMSLDYWEAVYPGAGKARVDWSLARSEMFAAGRKKGIFQPRHVRGSGVWRDEDRVIVNMGDHLLVDGVRTELGNVKSRYFYTLGNTLQALRPDPLNAAECSTLVQACHKFKWTKPDSAILLAGALVTARVCGALPVRPHAWITGAASTGKSTLLEKLIRKILGETALYVQGNTTEAGVRQSLKADAVPVLFDEFETTGNRSDENIGSLIELMRASWADSGAVIVKGGASGNASHFQVRFAAIVSSIRTKLTNDADRGRFAVLELAPHGSDPLHWKELSGLLALIDTEYAERLFARTVSLIPVMLANYKLIKTALARRVDSRFGDQYGMILAGYSVLLQDGPIDESDAEFLAENVTLTEEKEGAGVTDHDDSISRVLTTKICFGDRMEASIGSVIKIVWEAEFSEESKKLMPGQRKDAGTEIKALATLGIRVESDFVAIATSGTHAEMEAKIWRGTKWSRIWGATLARLDGAKKPSTGMKIDGRTQRVVTIPIKHFDLPS